MVVEVDLYLPGYSICFYYYNYSEIRSWLKHAVQPGNCRFLFLCDDVHLHILPGSQLYAGPGVVFERG